MAGSVQLAADGKIIRVRPIRHDRAKEHGAFAQPTDTANAANNSEPVA